MLRYQTLRHAITTFATPAAPSPASTCWAIRSLGSHDDDAAEMLRVTRGEEWKAKTRENVDGGQGALRGATGGGYGGARKMVRVRWGAGRTEHSARYHGVPRERAASF